MSRSKKPNGPPSPAAAPPDPDETLEALLARLKITDWDVLLVGDGSGSNWNREAGWATVSVERATGERLVFAGAVSRGTVNIAEMMAYLQPLEWLASRELDRRKKQGGVRALQVHIVTDSEYCKNTGRVGSGRTVARNAGVWSAFDAFARHGFVLHWHWMEREHCALNRYCDTASKLARLLIKGYSVQDHATEAHAGMTPYDFNSSAGDAEGS